MGQIGNTSIIGEISMNPYISGQNSAKFWEGNLLTWGNSTGWRRKINIPTKVGVRYHIQFRCKRILKE